MMIYKRDRYDILLNRPGLLVEEKSVKEYYLVYGKRRSGKTTYLLNHTRNVPHTDIVCFITREMGFHEELKHRSATLLISPERLLHLQGQIFDWVYIDDYDMEGVLNYNTISEIWGILDRARKGALISISNQSSCQYFSLETWKFIDLGVLYS